VSISVREHKRYRVCGLHIGTSIPFPELRALTDARRGACSPDVEFEMGGDLSQWGQGDIVMTWTNPDGKPWLTYTKTKGGYRIHYPDLADFLVDALGRQVRCVAQPHTAPETIRHLFLDQVIPPLLNLRGREALHASAIRTAKGACAFIGQSGWGKSTLAAAFHSIGYPVLCDDCLLLKNDPDRVSVETAYPGLRLWDDSRRVLFGNTRSTLPVSQNSAKRRIPTPESNAEDIEFQALRVIYSLQLHEDDEPVNTPVIESLSVREAFMALVECAFRLDLSYQSMILRQMRVLERVAKEVPVRRLCLPDDLGILPAVREMILQDLKLL
jgi:hypothetical protein